MKDALKLKIICTANCKMDEIDNALLRKGRILTKYEFKKLSIDKTNSLLKKLNKKLIS
jgi:ATP-dependent 26S proteasome regulatory subunit